MTPRINILIVLCFALPATAQMAIPSQPQPDQMQLPVPIARMYAVYAHGAIPEQPYMDDSLKPVAPILNNLPFTSYESISTLEKETPWHETTLFPINAIYSMMVTPSSLSEEGVIELDTRIEMLQDNGEYKVALAANAAAAQNKALIFRGMPLHKGELVVVLLVGLPSDENQQESQPQEADAEQQEEQQEEEQEKREEDTTEEQEQTPQEMNETEPEGEDPEGLENLDALLESLEDIDKQEQVEERNRRSRIDFKGDWW